MEFPIRILIIGTFSCFGSPLRFIAQEGEVEIAKTDFSSFHICCFNLTTRVSGKTPAVGSLVVAEFDQSDGSIGIALEIGRLADDAIHHLLDLFGVYRWALGW